MDARWRGIDDWIVIAGLLAWFGWMTAGCAFFSTGDPERDERIRQADLMRCFAQLEAHQILLETTDPETGLNAHEAAMLEIEDERARAAVETAIRTSNRICARKLEREALVAGATALDAVTAP